MDESEFVIVLTEHRNLGNVFQPYLIHKKDKFYSTEKLATPFKYNSIRSKKNTCEKQLVLLIY